MPKKTLLVVAPGLPDFDRHAGSRRLYSWLRILATNTTSPSTYCRVASSENRGATRRLLARRIDHGVLFEFFHTAERMLPHLRLLRPDLPIAVSSADLHYVRESRAAAYAGTASSTPERDGTPAR